MKALKIFGLALLMIFVAQGKTFAEMPEISAGETYFDIFRGVYVLKGNVHVAANNHGFKATVTADEALVSVVKQKCWAEGHVKLTQDNIISAASAPIFSGKRKLLKLPATSALNTKKVSR
ncbi:MAG: hypothetical protein IJL14_10600 [Selenomonadaceae bacterium]|nr:hypothetical protein [Selenomonadaceae bacterium]